MVRKQSPEVVSPADHDVGIGPDAKVYGTEPGDNIIVARAPQAVFAAVAAVTADISGAGLGKDRRNTQQNFNFRGIDDVLNALSRLYVQHGLIVLPSYANRVVTERTAKSGGTLFSVTVEGTYTLQSTRDGSTLRAGPFIGEAMDSGDKATNKAMSIAYKYFAIQTFAIPTEGDNDPDATSHEVAGRQPVAGAQQNPHAPLLAEIDSFGPAGDKLAARIRKAFGVTAVGLIPADKIPEAIERVKQFRKAQAEAKQKAAAEPQQPEDDLPV